MTLLQGILLLAGAAALIGCERTTTAGGEVKSTVRYVLPPGDLTVRCDAATGGRCFVRIEDGGQERAGWLAVGASRRLTGVSAAARTCVVADRAAACGWTPVLPATRP